MNWTGIILGLFSMFAIGLGFVWVIRFEYLLGAYRWKWVMAAGILVCVASLFAPNFLISALLGITGGSIMWGAVELPHQEERVDHGLFRAHPSAQASPGLTAASTHIHTDQAGAWEWWSF